MDFSPRLSLPYIAPQQAQKHISFNEAMKALDLLVQSRASSRTITVPPGSPGEGDAYIVPVGATGAWAGMDAQFAVFGDGGWAFTVVAEGWLCYVADTASIAIFSSGAWSDLVTNGGASIAKFGINTSADLTNRLAVAADASLFTHDGASHRMVLNKASATDTASMVFQSAFSGRAEFGLTGDADFHVKVSPDGAAWSEALTIAASGGAVSLPRGQLTFLATQNASADANTLDDYEEGTFTPGFSFGGGSTGMAYGAGFGRYTKIGRLVQAYGLVTLTAKGSSTGAAALTGLPFTSSSVGAVPGAKCYSNEPWPDAGILLRANSTVADIFYGPSGSLGHGNFTNTTYLYFSISYHVD